MNMKTIHWDKSSSGIKASLTFENQTKLAEFVLQLARLSDEIQHHADMEIRYNRLGLNIITHDAKAVTEKDEALCREIEKLLIELNRTSWNVR